MEEEHVRRDPIIKPRTFKTLLLGSVPHIGSDAFFERVAASHVEWTNECHQEFPDVELSTPSGAPAVYAEGMTPAECLAVLLADGTCKFKNMTIGEIFWEAFDCEGYYCPAEAYFEDANGCTVSLEIETADEFISLYWKEPPMHS